MQKAAKPVDVHGSINIDSPGGVLHSPTIKQSARTSSCKDQSGLSDSPLTRALLPKQTGAEATKDFIVQPHTRFDERLLCTSCTSGTCCPFLRVKMVARSMS